MKLKEKIEKAIMFLGTPRNKMEISLLNVLNALLLCLRTMRLPQEQPSCSLAVPAPQSEKVKIYRLIGTFRLQCLILSTAMTLVTIITFLFH